jgi:hypothetical protein
VSDYLNEQLRTTDPVRRESGLSLAEIQVMRRAIVAAAADTHHSGRSPSVTTLSVAAALTLAVGIFIITLVRPTTELPIPPQAEQQRQLQFETPGGTRVVWVLNPQLDLPKDR